MARIKCHYVDCVLLDDGYCSAAMVEIDPDSGCLTYSPMGNTQDKEWEDEDELDWDDEEKEEEEDDWDNEEEEGF